MPKKRTDKEEQKQDKPQAIQWHELDKYIGQPIWNGRENKWRILDGYKRSGNTYAITFSDIADWVSFLDRLLYSEEVNK